MLHRYNIGWKTNYEFILSTNARLFSKHAGICITCSKYATTVRTHGSRYMLLGVNVQTPVWDKVRFGLGPGQVDIRSI